MEVNQPQIDNVLPQRAKPSLKNLGEDLLEVSLLQLLLTILSPFVLMVSFVCFALYEMWIPAVISIMVLSFVTYGSTSHDLVHYTLRLPRAVNDALLSLIELLSFRSGTAYRLSHLHHHAQLLGPTDIEGSAAHGSLKNALLIGPTMQIRLFLWSWQHYPRLRGRLSAEAIAIGILFVSGLAVIPWTPIPAIYAVLVIGGSWFYPLATVFFPHDAHATENLKKTRLFRGRFYQIISLNHLYHLEHHLYPAVPHHHWKRLADRLDPFFESEGIEPFQFLTNNPKETAANDIQQSSCEKESPQQNDPIRKH